ncbi:MAG: transporter substrate-binding domain-containing protein [Pseudomonadota bacterium]
MYLSKYIKALVLIFLSSFYVSGAIAGEALDRINQSGVLRVSSDASWPPQSFLNDQNEMDGFDVDVAKEIAKRMGVKAEFVTPEWAVITAGNWNGRWDISVGSMTPTSERANVLSFPAVYYYTPASVAVHKDSKAKSISDLNGKVVGACVACTYELYLQHDLSIDAEGAPAFEYQIKPSKIVSLKDTSSVMDDMRLGDGVRMDGFVDSLPAITEAIKNGYPFRILGKPVFYEPLAVAIDLGDAELDQKIASIINAMHQDGTLSRLSKKWYGIDYSKTN